MTNFYTQSIFGKLAKYLGGSFLMLAMVFAASLNVQGQTIFEEGLRADTMPDGWAATDVTFTTSAGGYARFTGGTGVLTSPSFDLSGVTGATLSYAVAQYGSGDSGPLTIEISTDGGTTWDAQLDTTGTPTSSTYLAEEVTLDASVVGQGDVMIRFSSSESVSDKRLRDILVVGPDGESIPAAIEVATIADLRAGTADGETRYKLTGEAVMSFYDSYQNRRYLTDGSAAIFSIDPNSHLDSNADTIGVGVTGLTGTLSMENAGALIQFTLDSESADATISSTGNNLTPEVITLADLSLDDTGKLITVEGVTFQETGTFSTGTNYTLDDGNGNTLTFRTDYYSADYIGDPIPDVALDITGVVLGYGSAPQMFARSSADMDTVAAPAEPVTVTFRVNTATIPDTLGEDGFVQVRGELKATLDSASYGAQNVTWDDASTPVAENVGGDYWTVDVTMAPGDTLVYKYWVGLDASTGAAPNGGWEAGSDNIFALPEGTTEDQVLDVVYYDIGNGRVAPFETYEDSVSLYFRVNMAAQIQVGDFNPDTDVVGIRGAAPVFDWGVTKYTLDREGETSFYSGVVRVDNAAADTLGEVEYKFFGQTDSDMWETSDNRKVNIPSADSTIHWVYFSNTKPTAGEVVTTDITFEVNVAILEVLGYFDSGIGDKVVVRGEPPLDWGTSDFNTASFDDQDIVWRLTNSFTKAVDSEFKYKYYIEYDESRTVETSDNYIEAIAENVDFGYEEPVTTGGSDRMFHVENAESQGTGVQYFNDVNLGGLIDTENTPDGSVAVTFRIDMTEALSHEVPFRPGEDSLYFQIESKYTALTNGFRSGGGYFEDMVNNGTPEDIEFLRFTPVDGETNIYELTLDLQLPTINDFGFVVRYGQPFTEYESMVVNGSGFGPGRRYYQFIEPTSVAYQGSDPFLGELYVSQWPSTYTMPTVEWMAEDLDYSVQPDYEALATSVEEPVKSIKGFELSQNYPNPFNPTTNIRFTLAQSVDVNLTVYNLLGQKVKTLISNKRMGSGTHTVAFDASSLSSGVYFYRLEAGDFVSNKRMTLIK